MSWSHTSGILGTTLPTHCTPVSPFLYNVSVYFGACLPTPLAFTSTLLGYLSVLAWLCAQMPQIYKNYQIKSTAGLSPIFLVEWLMGDITNLLGCIFTKQATWQIVVAVYYCFVDICLVVQYFWYAVMLPWWREGSIYSSGSDTDDDASSDLINSLSPINSSFVDESREVSKTTEEEASKALSTQPLNMPRFSDVHYEKQSQGQDSSPNYNQWLTSNWAGPSPRTMVAVATLSSLVTPTTAAPIGSYHSLGLLSGKTPIQIAGTILSWCSTVLYLGSRLPQLYKNWTRQSTTGLSPYLFIAAFCGNLFYSSSMLTNPNVWHDFGPHGGHGWAGGNGSKRSVWITTAAPFFLGAFGVLFLDASMGVQFWLYGEEKEKIVKVRDSHGPSRWRSVSGWMRGWIPTIKKEKIVDPAQSQRLLSESRELDRHAYHSRYGGI